MERNKPLDTIFSKFYIHQYIFIIYISWKLFNRERKKLCKISKRSFTRSNGGFQVWYEGRRKSVAGRQFLNAKRENSGYIFRCFHGADSREISVCGSDISRYHATRRKYHRLLIDLIVYLSSASRSFAREDKNARMF